MSIPLLDITITSVYKDPAGQLLPLPSRMAHCTPDMNKAIHEVSNALENKGGHLHLSDLFRSFDMQLQSHLDFVNGRKNAFSPPPGGSLHEAGRALDLDLDQLHMKLVDFWEIARTAGLSPIIDKPTAGVSESWHFDCRGSHQLVYDYYKSGKAANFPKPYAAMAASAILAIGVKVEKFEKNQTAAAIQSALIRLGQDIGNMDGSIGSRTINGLAAVGVTFSTDLSAVYGLLERLLRERFPAEFGGADDLAALAAPGHVT